MSKDKIILFDDKKNCCACGACMNVCPKDAIRMEEDEYGFLYPQIDETKCVQCGACKKVCAYQNEQVKNAPIKCYAAVNKNKSELMKSASGGIFAAMATSVLKEGGVVFGAALDFEDGHAHPHHVAVRELSQLYRLQGSKYVQSAIENTYMEANQVARGFTPSSLAFSSLITTRAAAPSLIAEELPAVTMPSLVKAGFRVPSFSTGVRRGPSSVSNTVFRQMSVEDNIAAVLEMTDKPLDYQKDKLESLIAEFRLQKVRKNKGNQLSGGERRRTEIARCLAIDPKFIMLDEPFAGVDPIAVEDIQQIVWKLKDRNIGILITDHNVQETLSITDRAYLLFEGKILFQGTPEELAENKIVREKYLSNSFVLRRKDFMV